MINRTIKFKSIQSLDRIAITLMVGLTIAIAILLFQGDHSVPRVRSFTWQDKQIGVENDRFVITFTRPMDRASVEKNLQINPPLPGKFSWAGRRLVYTLISPAPYGTEYQLTLQKATDKYSNSGKNGAILQPFNAKFRTRDRAFAYIGVEGENSGQLMLVNLSAAEPKPIVLTPKDLVVSDFKFYPQGDRILFLANDRNSQRQGALQQQLYEVTTGIHTNSPEQQPVSQEPAGKLKLVLDNKDYQILKFDLSPDGQTIVMQLVSRRNPGEFGIWTLQPNSTPKPLPGKPGGDFLITPDSKALAVTQGEGLAIVPLTGSQAQPLDFLPKYGSILTFSRDGLAAATVKFNQDFTRSLFLVNTQGTEKELQRINGSILNAKFDPTNQTLYCLFTKLVSGEQYQEQPYIAAINLKTGETKKLLEFSPNQRQVQMNLSPDGIAILFDQPLITPQPAAGISDAVRTDDNAAIVTSRLWLLPISSINTTEASTTAQPEELPITGVRPVWLP
ncbi:Ig-like domain-containing protein [Phormidium sp. LEGE 05292]|uniref:Ig-like domain-containing protein n=1 Tax=[Phormidium] sp. LEGE 05292 TaxID=767427 RepID=UPI00188069E2|nr:Ig-like domain-containing protein [Phormidium sp. LEGE 05292]MBE9226793.1 Ig-like domain-containing protein [Phormidium sp. LEGE 05292]